MYARSFVAGILVTLLAGCSVQTAALRSGALSSDDVIEDTTDKFLLLNILRAKDKAPLHFDEIPIIHESFQATASVQATWPFGPLPKSASVRNTINPGFNLQVTPTFDVSHLDTKDFVTGLASPVDPKFVKYWLDSGLDRRIVMLLFFSSATLTEVAVAADGKRTLTTVRLMNSPRDAIATLEQQAAAAQEGSVPAELRCDAISDFQRYLKFINSLDPMSPRYYKDRRLLITVPYAAQMLKDVLGADPTKYEVTQNPKDATKLDIYALSPEAKTTLCPMASGSADTGTCIQLQYVAAANGSVPGEAVPLPVPPIGRPAQPTPYCALFNGIAAGNGLRDARNPSATISVRMEMRSVGEMIQFLGDLLQYQEELATILAKSPGFRLNDPLTFGYCSDNPSAGCDDVFFSLQSNTCNSRFSVEYRGRIYAVPNYNPSKNGACEEPNPFIKGGRGADHTLEVLSVVHQMVNLQKSAQDIRETPTVELLP
jgi:hypothetical protein